MKTQKISRFALGLLLGATAVAFTGCSSSDEPAATDATTEPVEIRLTASLTAQVESRTPFGLDESFYEECIIEVMVKDHQTQEILYSKAYGKISTSGIVTDFYPEFIGSETKLEGDLFNLYFPLNGHSVDIYAVATHHPYISEFEFQEGSSVSSLIEVNQDMEYIFAFDDILYATALDVKASTEPISLVFEHRMSKIEVQLNEGLGATGKISGLTLTNVAGEGMWTWSEADGFQCAPYGSRTTDINMQITVGADDWNEAIIIPQTIAGGTELIQVKLKDGTTFTWAPSSDLVFAGGYKYRFNITVQANGLSVDYTLAAWNSDGTTTDIDFVTPTEFNDPRAVDLGMSVYWANVDAVSYGAIADINWSAWEGWRLPTLAEFQELFSEISLWTQDWDTRQMVYSDGENTLSLSMRGRYPTSTAVDGMDGYIYCICPEDAYYGMWDISGRVTGNYSNIRLVHDK